MIHALGWPLCIVLALWGWAAASTVAWLPWRWYRRTALRRDLARRSARVLARLAEEEVSGP